MKKIILITMVLMISISSLQAKYFTWLGGSGVEITKILTHANGAVTLFISDASNQIRNLDGCVVTSRVHLKGDLPGHKEMVATALMAYTSNNNVGFHAQGCETTPFWGGQVSTHGTAIINNIWVYK